MLFAGLYDSVTLDGQSEPLWTFTIVTTAASSDSVWLHDRQPVILTSQDALDRWLDTSTQDWDPKLSRLLDPYSDSDSPLECYAVPREVGKVGVESPTFIEPVEKRKDGIEALFTRQQAATKARGSAPASPARGKRKRESSPLVEAADPASPKRLDRGRDVKTGRPTPIDVDVDDASEAADSDVKILPSFSPVRVLSPHVSHGPPPKIGQGDSPSPSSSQCRHSARSPPPQTMAPKLKLKPTTPRKQSEPAKSTRTPKITSFFAKT